MLGKDSESKTAHLTVCSKDQQGCGLRIYSEPCKQSIAAYVKNRQFFVLITRQLRGLYGASTEKRGETSQCRAILSTPEGASATPSMLISSRKLPRKPKQRSWRQTVLKSIRHNTCCTFEQVPYLRSNKTLAKQGNSGSAIRTY